MFPYIRTFQLAWSLARHTLPQFNVSANCQIKYSIKSGNLAACFLGFSIHSGPDSFRRSAQLGVLASVFDLASDGFGFAPRPISLFNQLLNDNLDRQAAHILFELMKCKKAGAFSHAGLDRGIGAFRAVIKHLRSEDAWLSDADVISTGIVLQVVDDLLDYRHDMRRGQLNFLRDEHFQDYLVQLIQWDYETVFCDSRYPRVLFYAIKRAKSIALKLSKVPDIGRLGASMRPYAASVLNEIHEHRV